MANYTSTRDLIVAVLRNCGELTEPGSSPYYDSVLEYMNKYQLDVFGASSPFGIDCGDTWNWAKADDPLTLTLLPEYATGTVSLTQDQATGTFLNVPSFDPTGWYLQATDDREVYRIRSWDNVGNIFTLDTNFIGSTGALGFRLFKLDYDLVPQTGAKIMRLADGFTTSRSQTYYDGWNSNGKISGVDERSLHTNYPFWSCRQEIPRIFAEVKERDGIKTVRFNAYPRERTIVRMVYIPVPNDLVDDDANIPPLPREFRAFLVAAATYDIMMDKDDTRADSYAAIAVASLKSLVRAERKEVDHTSSRRGELIPRPEGLYNRGPWPYI